MLSDQKEKGSVFFCFLIDFFFFLSFLVILISLLPSSFIFFFIIFLFWLFAFSPLALLCSCFCWTVSVSVLCVHAQLLSVDADRSTKRDFGLVSRFHVASGGVGQSGGVSNGPQPNGGPTGWHGQLQELNQTVLHTHSLNTLQKKKELELSLLPENAKSKRIENKVVCHTIVQKRKGNFQEIIEFVEVGNVRDTFFFHSYFTKIFQNVGSSCAPKCFLTVVIKLFQSR